MNRAQPTQRNLLRKSTSVAHHVQPINLKSHSRLLALGLAIISMAIVLGCPNVGVAEDNTYDTFRSLRSIRALNPSDTPGVAVDFEATVTFVDGMREFLFVQNGQDAIFVFRPDFANTNVRPNQRVRVRGRLAKGDLLPIVADPVVTVLGDGNPPTPEDVAVIGIEHDCRYLNFEFEILQTSVGATETFLYAKTESNKDVCIAVQHPDGTVLPNVSRIAGNRVQCAGVLGLEIEGGAFREPGYIGNTIAGYKILCSSPDALKIIAQDNKLADSKPAQTVALSFLAQDDFPEGRFLTFGQICLVDHAEPKGFVISDGSVFKRFKLHSTNGLEAGMVVRVGGKKSNAPNGQSQFEVDYLRHLTLSEFPSLELSSVKSAVETFAPDRRIAIEGTPLRVEDRDNGPHLILGEGKSTVAVQFQDAAIDSLAALDPSIAGKVRVTGVTKTDDRCDFKLVVVRPDDAQLLESKTSVSRMVAIGLGSLLAICGLAAIWIRLLKSQVAQKQRFECIFDNAGCPIVVFNGNLEIVDANQLTADMTGYTKAQLRSMSVTQIDPHLPKDQVMGMLAQTMKNQDVAIFPTKVQTQDKRILDVEVHCRNLSASEDPNKAAFIAIFPDTTERKRYENELKEARDEAIKANLAKSQFVASMSHELRTPLNGVIGMTQLLESTELTPTQADYLAACKSSGETLLTVIGDVLDFSKMEAGKMELEPQETNLIPFVENVVRATSLQPGTRHVDLASFVDPRLGRSVMVDSDRLRQVLFNIIGNAAKFTSQGSITVTANCSEVTDQYADVRFVVSDTGIGIPQEKIAGLFEAFEQYDSSTTRQYGGTGLGLAICRQIVELMDGQIYAQSVEGKGSDFIVEVRLPFTSEGTSNKADEIEIVPTDQRLAVIGMSDSISKILREMFEAYQVDASFFSESEQLPKGKFDVVLLNNKGDVESAGKFVKQQRALFSNDAPMVIPVVPPNCVVEQQQWESQGVEGPIFKPFTQTRFVQPIVSRQERGEQPGTERWSATNVANRTLRVLICEDNTVNQMFAKEICRRAGIEVVICGNGQIGIDTLASDSKFDAIFMDCHMPVMDGFEVTRKIQEMIQMGSIPELPVIALTANALAGDRDRCLEAGMVDYLAKPFVIKDFLEKLHTHATEPSQVEQVNSDSAQSAQSGAPVFDLENLTSQFDDRAFALNIASHFISTFPEYRAEIEDCLNEQNAKQTLSLAHRLKGSAATVKADRITSIAFEIESAAQNSRLEQIQAQVSELLSEFDNFVNAVRDERSVC